MSITPVGIGDTMAARYSRVMRAESHTNAGIFDQLIMGRLPGHSGAVPAARGRISAACCRALTVDAVELSSGGRLAEGGGDVLASTTEMQPRNPVAWEGHSCWWQDG